MRTLSRVLSAAALFVIVAFSINALGQSGQIDPCAGARDLRLTNGKIATMDARGSTVSEVTIQNGKFTAVGPRSGQRLSPCTREINLRGRTVVPGLIDNHNHIVLLGIRPGYHTPLESATSIADVQATIKARAKSVPAGQFITSATDASVGNVLAIKLDSSGQVQWENGYANVGTNGTPVDRETVKVRKKD